LVASELLDELVSQVGFQTAIRICRAYGGTRLAIPSKTHETHPLALLVGLDAARTLSATYGGQRLAIPAEVNALLMQRNATICQDYVGGTSISTLARRHRLSRKMITKILDAQSIPRRMDGDD
jgi:hypothetical protein